jgi:hypothetical protein
LAQRKPDSLTLKKQLTIVHLGNVPIPGLPFPLGKLNVDYDGTVYGAGFTLVYGGELRLDQLCEQ